MFRSGHDRGSCPASSRVGRQALDQRGVGAAVIEHFELGGDVVPASEIPDVTNDPGMADLGGVHDRDRRSGATPNDD